MSSTCPACGAADLDSPFCISCQLPFDRTPALVPGLLPEPAPAAGHGPAGFFRRFFALTLDWIVLSILADIVRFAYSFGGGPENPRISVDAAMGLSAVIFFLYFTLFTAENGQTLGKMVLGARVVRTDGTKVSHTRAFVRALGYIISSVFFWLGFLWALWDPRKQTWHDKIAGTVVVRVESKILNPKSKGAA